MSNNQVFLEFIQKHEVCIVQFGSTSCTPCIALHARLQAQKDLPFLYVDWDENREFCAQRNVLTVPTVQFFMDGKCMIQQAGYFSLDGFMDRICLMLDMKKDSI